MGHLRHGGKNMITLVKGKMRLSVTTQIENLIASISIRFKGWFGV
jgi:hypothetical protein